jgi:hypothetical protein
MKNTITPLSYLSLLVAAAVFAAEAPEPISIGSRVEVPVGGAITNAHLVAQHVLRGAGTSREQRWFVIFEPGTSNALATLGTHDVYFLNGRVFRVVRDAQSFRILLSRPVGTTEMTPEVAENLLAQTDQQKDTRDGTYKRFVDLSPVLQWEKDAHVAQLPFLKSAKPVLEAGQVVVYFESHQGGKGKVTFDKDMNPLSITLLSRRDQPAPPKGR